MSVSRGSSRVWQSRGAHVFALLALLGVAGVVCAETRPTKGTVDPRIRTALYHSEEIYRLVGYVGYDIELIFEKGERFMGKGGGDLDGVIIEAHEHQVHIKPQASMVATNLVIYTDRRAYRFDYSVSAQAPDRFTQDLVYAVRFTYPPEEAGGAHERAAHMVDEDIRRELERARLTRVRNTDYGYCGHRAVKPVAAWDDGVQTHLLFGARAEIPALFVRNADGSESLLNFSMDEGEVVIHRLAPTFIVRRGRLTGCIVNRAFRGAGERLESGTVSPRVERTNRGPPP